MKIIIFTLMFMIVACAEVKPSETNEKPLTEVPTPDPTPEPKPTLVEEPKEPTQEHRIIDGARPALQLLSSCLLYTSPSPRDATLSRMPSSA